MCEGQRKQIELSCHFVVVVMDASALFRCPRCPFFAPKFTRVVLHLERTHSLEPNFFVTCGIDGCQQKYKVMESFRSHLYRKHANWLSTAAFGSGHDTEPPDDSALFYQGPAAPAAVASSSNDELEPGQDIQEPSHDSVSDQGPTDASGAAFSPFEQSAPGPFRDRSPELERPTLQHLIIELRRKVAKLFFNLSGKHKVAYSVCDALFQEVESLICVSLKGFAEHIRHELSLYYNVLPGSLSLVLDCTFLKAIFDVVRSQYQRTQYAKASLPYTEPQQYSYAPDDCASFQYVSVCKVVQNLLQCKDADKHLVEPEPAQTTMLRSFRDGSMYKSHMNASEKLVHILLYMDELEIVNPLGPARGLHKLLAVYYTVLDIHPRFRSQLKLLHLAVIAKYADVLKYGLGVALRPLLQELKELQNNGMHLSLGGHQVLLKVSVLACSGDNLSMNRLGGFTCSFSRGSVCRFCMAHSSQLPVITREELCELRSRRLHESHLAAIQVNAALYKRLYGVNEQSAMALLEDFDPTLQLPPDLMHDLFEGAFPFVLKHVLRGLFDDGILCEEDLEKVVTFEYGRNDKTNRPAEISTASLDRKSTMKGTASQKWCLFRLLPQIFASSIPEGNKHWEVYLLLREVVDLVLADELPAESLSYLELKIQQFLRAFVACYPSAKLIPKLHYMIHYPRMITLFGPLKQVWCMRFEAKHQYFKNVAVRVKNFRNICKTLAERHQLLQSYEFSEQLLAEPAVVTGTKPIRKSLLLPCVQDMLPDSTVWQVKTVTVLHITYHVGDVLVMSKGEDAQFSQITNIFFAGKETVLLLEKMNLVEFNRHRYSFTVAKSGDMHAIRPGDEAVQECLDLYLGGEVIPRSEVVLLN